MKILIISAVFPPEPVVSAQIMFELANELARENDVTVLIPRPSRPMGFNFKIIDFNNYNFKVIPINSFLYPKSKLIGRLIESCSMGYKAANYIKTNHHNIDIIYNGAWPIFGQFLVAFLSKQYRIQYIISIQDLYPESIKSKLPKFDWLIDKLLYPLYLIDKYSLKNALKIHVISKKMMEYVAITRHINMDKLYLIYNWQNLQKSGNYLSKNVKNEFTFMYLGNLGSLAGLDLLIHAFIKANIKNARLMIAGSGSEKPRLISLAQKYNSLLINFIDVPDGKVLEIQQQADVLLLPIKKDFASSSVPSKLIAYQLSSKPIIACVDSNSDTATVINDCNCGWVVESENIDKLAETMSKVVQIQKEELIKLGQNGYTYANQNYTKEHNLKKLTALFNQ